MKKLNICLVMLLLVIVDSCSVHSSVVCKKDNGITYFVAKDGNNNWSGLLPKPNAKKNDGPFLTIQKAVDIVKPGDSCLIRSGIYREMITPKVSGDSLHKIVFTSYRNEKVVVSGCDLLNHKWKNYAKNIYRIPFEKRSEINMVFVDEKLAPESRWPNSSGDLLKPAYDYVNSGSYCSMTNSNLPENIDLTGATLYGFFGKEWALQTFEVSAYDSDTKIISFHEPERRKNYYGGHSGWDRNYAPRNGNRFYLTDNYGLLDTDKEWYYDTKEKELYLYSEIDASEREIESKARNFAIDLSACSFIEFSGFEIFGAGIQSDDKTHHCLIKRVKGLYVDPGIHINGSSNEVKNCEFAYCMGNIVSVGGISNRIINNYVHDGNFTGTWDQILSTSGTGHLVSHNTVSRAGGGCISPGGKNMRFEYNEVSYAGLIRHDIGGFYIANSSGGNTVIDHNWVHDVYGNGIYLDNSTSDFIIHHNVIWNCGWQFVLTKAPSSFLTIGSYDAIRLNTPGNYNLIYNNTCYNRWGFNYWGRNFKKDMYGDQLINNIFTGSVNASDDVVRSNNLLADTDPLFQDQTNYNFQLTAGSPAIDNGLVLSSITESYNGSAPDCGAYEFGEQPWIAGHDFKQNPNPEFRDFKNDYMNLIKNGGFEDKLNYWEKIGPDVGIITEDSWGIETANTRMQSNAAKLHGNASEIRQTVYQLKSLCQYVFSGWVKVEGDSATAEFTVKTSDGQSFLKVINGNNWKFVTIDYKNSSQISSATISVKCVGSGIVYCDDFGVLMKVFK